MPYKIILLLIRMKWAKILFIYYMFDDVTSNFLFYVYSSKEMTENLVDGHVCSVLSSIILSLASWKA